METDRKLQEDFVIEDDRVVKKQEIEITYDLEGLYFERENLLRERLYLIQESTNLKEQYDFTMERLNSIEKMIEALTYKDEGFVAIDE